MNATFVAFALVTACFLFRLFDLRRRLDVLVLRLPRRRLLVSFMFVLRGLFCVLGLQGDSGSAAVRSRPGAHPLSSQH